MFGKEVKGGRERNYKEVHFLVTKELSRYCGKKVIAICYNKYTLFGQGLEILPEVCAGELKRKKFVYANATAQLSSLRIH